MSDEFYSGQMGRETMALPPAAPPMKKPMAPPPPRPMPPPVQGGAAPAFAKLGATEIEAPRIVINGVEGIGKTSLGAFAPSPGVLMARGETGFATLRGAGMVPDCMVADVQNWPGLLALIDALIVACPVKTLILDALGGFERLCHEHVCNTEFGGEWGDKGFGSYQKGYDVSVSEWLKLLQRLDRLKDAHKVTIVIIGHSTVKPFKNPLGLDHDRYVCDCHAKTWGVTHKWADAVLFYNFRSVIDGDGKRKRAKGIGDCRERVIYTQRHDSYDAKNRFGMDGEFQMPDDPALGWVTLWQQITRTVPQA